MAPNQSEGFNRRQLLGSAAGLVAVGVAPDIELAQGAAPAEVVAPEDTPVLLNVCSTTAARLAEIAGRNRIRAKAGLPLLSTTKELRRMKNAADAAKFEEFAARYSAAVWDAVLAPARQTKGDPYWRPTGFMEGLRFQSEVSRILRSYYSQLHR